MTKLGIRVPKKAAHLAAFFGTLRRLLQGIFLGPLFSLDSCQHYLKKEESWPQDIGQLFMGNITILNIKIWR